MRRVQEGLPEALRQAVPAGSAQAARAGDRGGVQELDAAAGGEVSPGREHHRPVGHGGERAVDGLRQHGRRLAAPASRSRAIRPPARTSSTASSSINAQGEDVVAGIRTPLPVDEMPKWNKAVHKQLLEIKDKLEKHYSDVQDIEFTIEKRHAVHAADPQRQADRRGGGEDRLRHGQGKADRREDGRAADSGRRPHAAACCRASRPPRKAAGEEGRPAADDRPARVAGRGGRQAGVHRGRSGRAHARRREGAARPQGNEPRRHRRHALGRRHPHQHRRHDEPRGGRRPRLGPLLRRRRRRDSRSTRRPARSRSAARRSRTTTRSRSTARPAR